MGPLRLAFAAAALLVASPAAGQTIDRWARYIAEASTRFGVPEPWIRRVMRAESGGRTTLNGRPITSRAGAMGLMQVMPGTYAEMARDHGLGADPHDPRDNILAGAAYLRAMHDRYGYPGLFAAYNAGPGRYEAYLRGQRGLPTETRVYLAQVANDVPAATAARPESGTEGTRSEDVREGLFFPLRPLSDPASGAENHAENALFAIRAKPSARIE